MEKKLELYYRTAQLAEIGIWELNLQTNVLFWDCIAKTIHEVPENFTPTLDKILTFYENSSDAKRIAAWYENLIKKGEGFVVELKIITYKGNEKWIKFNAMADFKDGVSERIFGTIQDITHEKILIENLRLNEEKFRQAFELAPIGIALVTPEGKWLKVNDSLCKLVGYSESELMALTFQDITHPEDLDIDLTYVIQMLAKEIKTYQMEKRYFHKDGHIVCVLLSVSLVLNIDGSPLYFISQIKDITEEKNISEELKRERQRLAGIIEGTNVGTWEWHIPTGCTKYNERWAGMLGYTLAELRPFTIETWNSRVHPDDLAASNESAERCFRHEVDFYDFEYRMKHKDGHWVWIQDRGKVVEWDANGGPVLMLGTHTDISDRKKTEQERADTLAIMSEQNKRLINFAHIVSHNLKSHVNNFKLILSLLTEVGNEEKEELMALLKTNASNLDETVNNLNDIVLIQTNVNLQVKDINLLHEVEKALTSLSGIIAETKAKIVVDIPTELIIKYNPAYIESILLNLLTNAIKYGHPERVPKVIFRTKSYEKYIVLEVEDNGLGIDLNLYGHHLFGMYKTFHANKDAKGIGLFITKNQVEALGGKIDVESKVGEGTTFKIFIN